MSWPCLLEWPSEILGLIFDEVHRTMEMAKLGDFACTRESCPNNPFGAQSHANLDGVSCQFKVSHPFVMVLVSKAAARVYKDVSFVGHIGITFKGPQPFALFPNVRELVCHNTSYIPDTVTAVKIVSIIMVNKNCMYTGPLTYEAERKQLKYSYKFPAGLKSLHIRRDDIAGLELPAGLKKLHFRGGLADLILPAGLEELAYFNHKDLNATLRYPELKQLRVLACNDVGAMPDSLTELTTTNPAISVWPPNLIRANIIFSDRTVSLPPNVESLIIRIPIHHTWRPVLPVISDGVILVPHLKAILISYARSVQPIIESLIPLKSLTSIAVESQKEYSEMDLLPPNVTEYKFRLPVIGYTNGGFTKQPFKIAHKINGVWTRD